MKKSIVFLFLVVTSIFACKGWDGRGEADKSASQNQSDHPDHPYGPDPILLRFSPGGGTDSGSGAGDGRNGAVRAYKYPQIDSVIWSAGGLPRVQKILGFDAEAGIVSFINTSGNSMRLDMRMGQTDAAGDAKQKLSLIATANGSDIYGVSAEGEITRLTRSGTWSFKTPARPRALFPVRDGGLIIAGSEGGETFLWRMQPPDERLLDTLPIAEKVRPVCITNDDIVCFATETGLTWVRSRGLTLEGGVDLGDKVVSAVATPSADRLYAVTNGTRAVYVIDRYAGKVANQVTVPGLMRELRMDPLGRYLLARPVKGDSAWVIAIGDDRLLGVIDTKWRADLPTVAPDGSIVSVDNEDVFFLDTETLQPIRTIARGAKDFWYFFFWNGFRPRAAGLDSPVNFERDSGFPDSIRRDSTGLMDSIPGNRPPALPNLPDSAKLTI